MPHFEPPEPDERRADHQNNRQYHQSAPLSTFRDILLAATGMPQPTGARAPTL
jgi:hypothetical protein